MASWLAAERGVAAADSCDMQPQPAQPKPQAARKPSTHLNAFDPINLGPSTAHHHCSAVPQSDPAPQPCAGFTSLITRDALEKAAAGAGGAEAPLPTWEEFRQQVVEGTAKFPSRKHPFLFAGEATGVRPPRCARRPPRGSPQLRTGRLLCASSTA